MCILASSWSFFFFFFLNKSHRAMISKEVPSKRDDTKGEKAGNVAVGQLCRKLML